jgi:hypothetical protein
MLRANCILAGFVILSLYGAPVGARVERKVGMSMARLVTLITVFCVFAAVTFWSVLYVAAPLTSREPASQSQTHPILKTSSTRP